MQNFFIYIVLFYLFFINLAGAIVVAADKWKAQHNRWRVPERVLFGFCLAGGCVGVYAAMRLCRHKTLHKRFMLGIPAIFILQMVIILFVYYHLHFS